MKPTLRILLIEDSKEDAFLVLHHIKTSYEVVSERVETSQGMRAALKERSWDLILSDYQMPQFNGLEALKILKESNMDIPLIVISGAIGEDVAVETMRNGARDYIMKNNLQRLLPAVERELRESEIRVEQRKLAQIQKQTKARLHLQAMALEAAANCIVITAKDGTILWTNQAFTELTGFTVQEAIGQKTVILKSGAHVPAFYQDLWQTILAGNVWHGEMMNHRKDGTLYTEEMTITPVKNQEKEITHFIAVKQNITQRKLYEKKLETLNAELEQGIKARTRQLKSARDEAQRANQAKSQFLANMSHELRTPLNAILGYSQLMKRNVSLLPEQKEILDIINRSGEHLLALINDVLDISKIEAGLATVEMTTFDLFALFHYLEKMFRTSAKNKGLQFKITWEDDVPQYVVTDENKLRQVLINILGNAVKFTEQGGITMHAAVKNKLADLFYLTVSVEDTGIGIGENELDKVFEYFEQAVGGRKKESGTGLGLAISRDFVQMMGGKIRVESREGTGTTFQFEIKVQEGSASELREIIETAKVTGLARDQKIPRILVADDIDTNRSLLVKILETAGFEVQEAADGREAVERFEQFQPHFIWMDVRMPVMDGFTATRQIKAGKKGKSTVIAALTGLALEEERTAILDAGFDDFVRKPFREQEIFSMMKKHLCLEYVVENKEKEAGKIEQDVELRREQLAALPADLLESLHKAAVMLDTDRCLVLIDKVADHDPHVGNVFKMLVKNLDFERILKLLEEDQ